MDGADTFFSYMDESFQIRTVGMVVAHTDIHEATADAIIIGFYLWNIDASGLWR